MIERLAHDNGVVTLRSSLLAEAGVIHAFPARHGGVSDGARASLHLGTLAKGEQPGGNTEVAENFRRLRAALGAERMPRLAPRQVHGAGVWIPPSRPVKPHEAPDADAVATDHAQRLLVARSADCVPVLLAAHDGRAVAAVHAGWRGLAAGVVRAAVGELGTRFGLAASSIRAAIGPAICPACYPVGGDVARAFEAAGLAPALRADGDGWRADLPGAARAQLAAAGLSEAAIDRADACTRHEPADFFSYRRDGPDTGQHAAVIGIP